jgi:trimeric autotransporter adhesin
VSYRFNNGDETERYGFIAQDLEQALPVSLHETIERSEPEHGLALIERQNDKDRTYRVSYGELTAPIVKAIQQQQQEIEAERQDIAALKAENDTLRRSIAALKERVTVAR